VKLLWCLVVLFLLPMPVAVTASAAPGGSFSGPTSDQGLATGHLAQRIHEFHTVPHACRIERDSHDTHNLVAVPAALPGADRL